MSNIILAGSESGTGSMTVTAPVTNSNRVLTLEDADGTLSPLISGTAQTASGTSVDFTGIPSWVKRITVILNGVSGTATAGTYLVRLGTGTAVTSGYFGIGLAISGATTATAAQTTGIYSGSTGSTVGSIMYGTVTLTKTSDNVNTWHGAHTGARDDSTDVIHGGFGTITLGSILDMVSVTVTTGAFDAGTVNIMYE